MTPVLAEPVSSYHDYKHNQTACIEIPESEYFSVVEDSLSQSRTNGRGAQVIKPAVKYMNRHSGEGRNPEALLDAKLRLFNRYCDFIAGNTGFDLDPVTTI